MTLSPWSRQCAAASATACRHCSALRHRQVAELGRVREPVEVRLEPPAAWPSTTPMDSKMPSPRCVLSSPTLSAGADGSTTVNVSAKSVRGSSDAAGSIMSAKRQAMRRAYAVGNAQPAPSVTLERPGRSNPGLHLLPLRAAPRREAFCGPALLLPGLPALRLRPTAALARAQVRASRRHSAAHAVRSAA